MISGKKKTYTVKNQLGITRKTKEIVYVSKTVQGARHDMYRFKEFKDEISPAWNLIVDLGYQGIENIVSNRVFLPYKARANESLSDYEKEQNKLLSSQRCRCEHVFAHMKHYKILGDEFRGSARLCDASLQAIAGLYNFKRQSRKRNI